MYFILKKAQITPKQILFFFFFKKPSPAFGGPQSGGWAGLFSEDGLALHMVFLTKKTGFIQ